MEAAGIKGDSPVAKRLDSLVLRLRRRQLVGSHNVAVEVVKLLRDVVASSRVSSFAGLLEVVEDVGKHLSEAGRKEPVIKNMVLRILKFLREEYQTALNSAITGLGGSGDGSSPFSQHAQMVQTPGSLASTPFAAFPLDTSAMMPSMSRQDTSYPFYSSAQASTSTSTPFSALSRNTSTDEFSPPQSKRMANMSMESISHSHSLPQHAQSTGGIQPIGTSSIFELLGHQTPQSALAAGIAGSMSSSFTSLAGSGAQTPTTSYSPTPLDSPTSPTTAHKPPSKPPNLRQGSTNAVAIAMQTHPSLHKMEEEFSRRSGKLKPVFIDAITELVDELGMVREEIAGQAMEHIHSAEIILTLGHSQTVEAFLKAAARKRKITVVVAETAPSYSGRSLALSLSAASIPTLLVPDSAIYSLMSRISKVILGTHIVQADGSLVAITGSLPIAKAAKAHNVPVVVVTGMFKVSNEYAYRGETGNLLEEMDNASPGEVLRPHNRLLASSVEQEDRENGYEQNEEEEDDDIDLDTLMRKCEVITPYWDRVPQELVSLFITNIGAHPSSMIFRLLKELFD